MFRVATILLSFSFIVWNVSAQSQGTTSFDIKWSILHELPDTKDGEKQVGLAGPFAGISNGALIIAGGANFPNGPAWEGGSKIYHDDVYVLEKVEGEIQEWSKEQIFKLSDPIAYGLAIETSEGLLCMGGNNDRFASSDVFLLDWDPETKSLLQKAYPDLPLPVTNLTGGLISNTVYLAASIPEKEESYFWKLDLGKEDASWEELPLWPGEGRTHAFGTVQNNGEEDCFYLFKGRIKRSNGISEFLDDSYVYHPKKKVWAQIGENHNSNLHYPSNLAAGTCLSVGANHILLFGGDDGQVFNHLEKLGKEIGDETDPSRIQGLKEKRDSIQRNHQGFSRNIWAYHTITDSWSLVGQLPFRTQVTSRAFLWDEQIIIPSGETSPCIRTPKIRAGNIELKTSFGKLNYVVLLAYLFLMAAMGLYLSKRQKGTDDFFKGGKRIPWWAAGLSIFGTQLSAITFMAIPAKTFATDWLYFFLLMSIIMVAPLIIRFFLPFYRRFNLTSAYEYLELRFNLITRLFGSSMYILLQIGRLGIVLLLPSLALSVVTGIDVYICICAMGILSIIYTVLGGIEAVIWTDVLQVVVLLGGAVICLAILYFNLDLSDITNYIGEYKKMKIFDFELSYSNPTFWVVIVGGLASNIVQYGSDQTVIQRYLTTKDEESAAKGIQISAWLTLPSALIFFSLGTLLFVYFKVNPIELSPGLQKTDAVFPWFIANNLPDGLSGLLIAAIFAASMSSLDSSMNSVSTVITTDFYRRFKPNQNEKDYLLLARIATIAIGILGSSLALLMAGMGISSLWDQFNLVVGLFAGGLGGVFLLGILTERSNSAGALIGLILSGLIQYLIQEYTDIHLLLYAFTGMASAFVIGFFTSGFFSEELSDKKKYTYNAIHNT